MDSNPDRNPNPSQIMQHILQTAQTDKLRATVYTHIHIKIKQINFEQIYYRDLLLL